ncbi:MAG: tRNA (guanosine(46)-N7)-methyltransferase TrmB [Acidobacteriota bacterium]|jgi:tRNA (guanine-N7-)-methyltransferase
MTKLHQKKPMLNPDDFIIARKRKKYRFAQFHNAANCFELDEWQLQPQSAATPVVVEVGAGTALFLVELAARHPEQQFVALDVKGDRLQKGARQALERAVHNIRFVRARADQLLEVVQPGTVAALWLTFSDPFPKKRDAKRRLTHQTFLEIYKNTLVDKGVLFQKTDNHDLFDWSLEQLVASGWRLNELSYDLHESDLPSDYKVLTSYEARWLAEGLKTYFVRAAKPQGEHVPRRRSSQRP